MRDLWYVFAIVGLLLPWFGGHCQAMLMASSRATVVARMLGDSVSADSLLRYGVRLMDERKYAEAENVFAHLVRRDPANAEAQCRMCQMEIVQGKNLERAEEYCLRAVQLNAHSAENHYWLGAVYGLQALNGELIDALAVASKVRDAFTKAIKLNPKQGNARFALAQYYLQAPNYAGGSFKEARKLALEAMPFDEVTARRILASVYRAEKKPAAAEDEYRRAIETDRKNVEVLSEFAGFYVNEQRYNEAVECYTRSLQIDSTNIFALQGLGDVFAAQNLLDEARTIYEQSLVIHPRHTASLIGIARCAERQRNKADAVKYYTLAVKYDPKSKLGKEAMRRLRDLKRKMP
jgi:tetratricopeptide (TPR) repeat protein